jgi:hypothetical protein
MQAGCLDEDAQDNLITQGIGTIKKPLNTLNGFSDNIVEVNS